MAVALSLDSDNNDGKAIDVFIVSAVVLLLHTDATIPSSP